jgi:receptor-type tyrosine-protein phosphatase R
MTTPMMEEGRVKCARYWPTVKYNEAKKCGDKVYGEISVSVIDGERQPGYILSFLRLCIG